MGRPREEEDLLSGANALPSWAQTLFLQDNSIARLEPGVLAPLASLRRLYLHNNSLRALEPGAFRAQSRLLELALTGNRLRGLRVGAFSGLAQLRVLYLAGNQLVQLLDFTFLHLQVRRRGGGGVGAGEQWARAEVLLHCHLPSWAEEEKSMAL